MLSAIAIVGAKLDTLEINQTITAGRALLDYSDGLQVATVLFVIGALLKCAQLPVHGWPIRVIEARTPVSALLQEGVANLGGLVLTRLCSVFADVPLAWSTCAQTGFMLMQCGLGLYELALFHIVAHSLHKAHAFLTAGTTVEQNRLQQITTPLPSLSGFAWFIRAGVARCFAVALACFGLHLAAQAVAGPARRREHGPGGLGDRLLRGAVHRPRVAVRPRPQGTLSRKHCPWLFAGLYLDVAFNRLTLCGRLASRPSRPQHNPTFPKKYVHLEPPDERCDRTFDPGDTVRP